jgi:hypothetical protein
MLQRFRVFDSLAMGANTIRTHILVGQPQPICAGFCQFDSKFLNLTNLDDPRGKIVRGIAAAPGLLPPLLSGAFLYCESGRGMVRFSVDDCAANAQAEGEPLVPIIPDSNFERRRGHLLIPDDLNRKVFIRGNSNTCKQHKKENCRRCSPRPWHARQFTAKRKTVHLKPGRFEVLGLEPKALPAKRHALRRASPIQ